MLSRSSPTRPPLTRHQAEHHFVVPAGDLVRRAVPTLVEVALVPAVVFYLVLTNFGLEGAMMGALSWFGLALVRRAVAERRLSAILCVAALPMAFRAATSLATHSAFAYFGQSMAAAAGLGGLFLLSAVLGRPIIQRLATDFCPLPPALLGLAPVRRLMVGLSYIWGVVLVVEAAGVAVAFLSLPLPTFAAANAGLYWGPTLLAAVGSGVWFVRSARRHGIRVSFRPAM